MKMPDEIIKHDRKDLSKEYMGKVIDTMNEPRNDCISRQSLLDKLDPLYEEKIKIAPDNMAEGFTQVSALIKREPPVTPALIPDGATNRDVIKIIFPDIIVSENEGIYPDTVYLKCTNINSKPLFFMQVSKRWLDAPYQQTKDKE